MKTCKVCGKSYPDTDEYFYPAYTNTPTCKLCISIRQKNARELRKQGLKICSACGLIKKLSEFRPKGQNCNDCRAKRAKEELIRREVQDALKAYDWEDEYQRVLTNTTKDKGLRNKIFNYELKPGETYRIKTVGGYREKERVGRLIQATEDFFVLESPKKIREAFRYDDYLLGEYEIERVKA